MPVIIIAWSREHIEDSASYYKVLLVQECFAGIPIKCGVNASHTVCGGTWFQHFYEDGEVH